MLSLLSGRIQPLPGYQLGEMSVLLDQLVISAFLDDGPRIHAQDTVAVADGGKPVGDHDTGAVQFVQGVRYLLLGPVVQGGGGAAPRAACIRKQTLSPPAARFLVFQERLWRSYVL